jgi:dUTP pyrophosphatase
MSLKIKILSENAKAPTKAYESDAGYDLYSSENFIFNLSEPIEEEKFFYENTSITKRNSALISTDIAIAIPPGYYGRVASRSGLSVKQNIEVGAGVIDQSYRGCVKVKLYCHSNDKVEIKKGDRIAQLIITPYSSPQITIVNELDSTDRGEGGFGSTGK